MVTTLLVPFLRTYFSKASELSKSQTLEVEDLRQIRINRKGVRIGFCKR